MPPCEPPRSHGYGILPEIEADAPLAPVKLKQTTYSLVRLSERFERATQAAVALAEKASSDPEAWLEPLVNEFERLREQRRNLDDHLAYHAYKGHLQCSLGPVLGGRRTILSHRSGIISRA